MEEWKVVTAYTPDYLEHYTRLAVSLSKVGVPHIVYQYEPVIDWRHTSAMKPTHVLRALEEHPGTNFLWLDADAEVVGAADDFLTFNRPRGDGGPTPCLQPWAGKGQHLNGRRSEFYLTGTMFVRNTEPGRHMMKLWQGVCTPPLPKTSQKMLQSHWGEWVAGTGATVWELPRRYAEIVGSAQTFERFDHPVIRHHQASRTMKRVVGRKAR